MLQQDGTGSNGTTESEVYTYDTQGRLATETNTYQTSPMQVYSQSGNYLYDLSNNLQGVVGRWGYNSNNQVTAAPSGNGLAGMSGSLLYDFADNLTGGIA